LSHAAAPSTGVRSGIGGDLYRLPSHAQSRAGVGAAGPFELTGRWAAGDVSERAGRRSGL